MNGANQHTAVPLDLAGRSTADAESILVRKALAGDGRAFANLVRPHLAMLYRVSYRVSRNRATAEDAVQETLLTGYNGLERYRPGTSLRAFLAAIAVKKAYTLLRSEIRRRVREESSLAPTPAPSGEKLMDRAEAAARIRAALLQMPEKRSKAALLRLEAGLSYAEIAEATGSSEGSARVLVHQAVKELRAMLGGDGDEQER
jgi:RNA polymerase sigma-70 factor, ECF subfamily